MRVFEWRTHALWIVHRRRAVVAGTASEICIAERLTCEIAVASAATRHVEQAVILAQVAHRLAKALLLP